MWFGVVVLLLGVAGPVLACSCSSYDPVKACALYHRMPVIFRGRVIDDNHDEKIGFGQITLYRFQVLEAFRGLPEGTHEVFIDPASLTSCYTYFSKGSDYLVYSGRPLETAAAITYLRRGPANFRKKPIPEAWKGLGRLPVYLVGGCNPTRIVQEGDADLGYLRSTSTIRPGANGWIEGRAVQNFSGSFRLADFVSAGDATVTVTASSGEHSSTRVEPDGQFRIGPVPSGEYSISAQSPTFGQGKLLLRVPTVDVPSGGCAVANASFETRSIISGTVVDVQGKPKPNVRVEIGELLPNGKVRVIPDTQSNSDQAGKFQFSNVPFGQVVLGANLNGGPTAAMPFDPVYAPGTQHADGARVFHLMPGQAEMGVSLRLPEDLPLGDLLVDVTWPDGSPAVGGARAFAKWEGVAVGFESAPKASHRVKLRLALGRKYEIRADWLDAKPGKFRIVDGDSMKNVEFTKSGQTVEVRLKERRPE